MMWSVVMLSPTLISTGNSRTSGSLSKGDRATMLGPRRISTSLPSSGGKAKRWRMDGAVVGSEGLETALVQVDGLVNLPFRALNAAVMGLTR